MPYITCNQKKTRNRVHISVCERCKGMACPDYRNYMQLSLFTAESARYTARERVADKSESSTVSENQV